LVVTRQLGELLLGRGEAAERDLGIADEQPARLGGLHRHVFFRQGLHDLQLAVGIEPFIGLQVENGSSNQPATAKRRHSSGTPFNS
jgi:hypothetical protein